MLGLACDYRIMADGPGIGLVETEAVSEMKIDGVFVEINSIFNFPLWYAWHIIMLCPR